MHCTEFLGVGGHLFETFVIHALSFSVNGVGMG